MGLSKGQPFGKADVVCATPKVLLGQLVRGSVEVQCWVAAAGGGLGPGGGILGHRWKLRREGGEERGEEGGVEQGNALE